MPVKAVPVEATEEGGEPPQLASEEPVTLETKTEDATAKPAAQPKRRSRAKAAPEPPAEPPAEPAPEATEPPKPTLRGAKAAAKAQAAADKAAEKAKKEQQAVDMKARVKCPICHRTVSQHCLLYTHVCGQAALNKKPKMQPLPEEPEARPRAKASASGPSRAGGKAYSPGDSDDERPRARVSWEEEFDEARVPPPPLVRQPVRQPYQPSYREQLMLRQRERQHHHALAQVAPIRKLFKR